MLEAFARYAKSRPVPRCSSVTDLGEPLDLVELLEQITRGFGGDRAAFESFESTLEKYRYRHERGRSRAMEYAETGRQLTNIAQETAPTLATGVVKAVGAAAPPIVGALERPRDLESVKRAFLTDLASLSHSDREQPVVLLLYAFDRHPDAPATAWVRKRLVPDATEAGALVVLSVDTREAIDRIPHDVPVKTILLDALRDEDVILFISDRLGIPPHTRRARSGRGKRRLPGEAGPVRVVLRAVPRCAQAGCPPGGRSRLGRRRSELEPFERLEPPEARRLVLCASALRRLNEPLLRAVGEASGIPGDSCDEAVETLLDSRTRPSWIAAGVAGWTIVPQIRQPLLHEFQRRDPMLLRAVHDAAARYHLDRLRELEGDDPEPATAVASFVPRRPPSERFADPAFMAALCDWLYHLMALDPKAAFEHMFAEAVDALYVDEADDAVRLLESGPGTAELAELDAYRRGLAEVARALRDNRHSEALGAIERLEALKVTDELLGVAVDFLAGSSGMQVGLGGAGSGALRTGRAATSAGDRRAAAAATSNESPVARILGHERRGRG